MARDRLVDVGLAAGALLVVLLAAVTFGVRGRPLLLAAGVVGALVVEAGLQRHHQIVRSAWARPAVKAAAVGAFLAAIGFSAAVAPAAGLSLLAGGLVGYLALVAGAAVGRALVS